MMLELPAAARPELSIVIVTYGGGEWPLRCLRALGEATAGAALEVIVVDNASPDGTGDRIAGEVRGITLIRNEANVGFAAAVNQGVARARAPAICLLNPDTLVREGWARPLLEALRDPLVGAVVPLYLEEDGRVQEAGSVVDRQGWTEVPEAGMDPGDPRVGSRRAVDYGSAACLVMRREVFHRVGGLDAAYAPAYMEDVDLALSLRQLGLWVQYEPWSRVVHGGTASSDPATRTRLIERNRGRFLDRWGATLAPRPPLGELDVYPHRLLVLRDAPAPVRLFVLLGGPASAAARRLLRTAAGRPDVRVTAVGPEAGERAGLLALGVEVSPGDREWFSSRSLHATAVVADGPRGLRRFGGEVERTQPHAAVVDLEGRDDPEALLLELGSASPAALAAARP